MTLHLSQSATHIVYKLCIFLFIDIIKLLFHSFYQDWQFKRKACIESPNLDWKQCLKMARHCSLNHSRQASSNYLQRQKPPTWWMLKNFEAIQQLAICRSLSWLRELQTTRHGATLASFWCKWSFGVESSARRWSSVGIAMTKVSEARAMVMVMLELCTWFVN